MAKKVNDKNNHNKSQTRVSRKNTGANLEKKERADKLGDISYEILSLLLFVLAVFTYISVTKFKGLPEDIQFIGLLGTYLMKGLEFILGEAAILVSFFILSWSIHVGGVKKIWSVRMWGVSLLLITIVIAIGIYNIPIGMNPWEAGKRGMGGGYIGGALSFLWFQLFGRIGSAIILLLTALVGLLMVIKKPLKEITMTFVNLYKLIAAKISNLIFYEVEVDDSNTKSKTKTVKEKVKEPVIINNTPTTEEIKVNIPSDTGLTIDNLLPAKEPEPYEPRIDEEEVLEEIAGESTNSNNENIEYQKPPLDLLTDVKSERTIDKRNIKDSIAILEETFANFGISVKVNQVSCGPAVTRYELTPAPGVKVSKIISLTDDLQLNLAAPGIRIEAPIPGKSAVGIEVPNTKVMSVGLKSLLQSSNFKKLKTPLAFALGEDIAGNTVVAKLNDMPHLLIAGSTGSGKSVCLNCIIMSFIYNATPDELKFVFIDPKMVELTVYNGIPHLLTPVVTNPKKAAVILRWMVNEMEKRYQLFAEKGVRDIMRYNQIADEKLPYIVIVIDELADLMMVAPVEVEDSICRLAQMARAAGMHLIVATQRPSVDVVTGIIKANIPSRIAFAVSSQADSRTILDVGGAEKLLGKGDMLFFPVGAVKPYRVQGAYVSDEDIERTVEFIKKQSVQVENNVEPFEQIEATLVQEEFAEDDLFWDAVKIFVDEKKASVSLLQRRLRIGYARAARLVDMMEDRGIVSELDNNKKREVLIDEEQFEKLYANQKLC